MRKFVFIFILLPFLSFAQDPDFSISSPKEIYNIGEPITLLLNLNIPADELIDSVYFKLSGNGDSLGNNWEIWDTSPIDKSTSLNENNNYVTNYTQEIVIANFDTGKFELPPAVAHLDSSNIYSNSLPFTIQLAETEDNKIKNIKPIFDIDISYGEYFWYYLKKYGPWLFAVILLSFGIYLLVKKLKDKSKHVEDEIQKIPTEVQLLEKLNKLKEKKLWENGHFKAYYSQIAEVIWEFIEHRYNVPTFEKTSNEILESLKWVSINEKYFKEIETFFQLSDGVKFAKINPLEKDNVHALEMAIHFIQNERQDLEKPTNTTDE